MALIFWVAEAEIPANTGYAPPAAAGAPRILGVRKAAILSVASGMTFEAGVPYGATTAAASQIQANVAAQQLVSGDLIPAGAGVFVDAIAAGEQPLNP